MSTLFPFIVISGSLIVILVVIARKYPQLTLLDVDSIKEVKQEQKKNELVKRRAEEQLIKTKELWSNRLGPLKLGLEKGQEKLRSYVGKVKRKTEELKPAQKEEEMIEKIEDAKTYLNEGHTALAQERFDDAEKAFISAIRLDMKNPEAYRGLGDVYFAQKQFKEAEETYKFLIQLNTKDDLVYIRLADIAEERGDKETAVDYLEQAILINDSLSPRYFRLAELLTDLKEYETAFEAISEALDLESENPRYLDKYIDLSIISGQKEAAEDGLMRLRMVNPENAKIDLFKDRIKQMQ